jgi:hypothetical protein
LVKIIILFSFYNIIENMNCCWKCGATKAEILENPQQVEESIEDNISETTLAPNLIGETTLAPNPIGETEKSHSLVAEIPVVKCDIPITECAENELDNDCKWYGTISTAYNNEREYYVLKDDEVIYFGRFPFEWAKCHEPGTGPNECEECFNNGMYHSVFIGYCVPCALNKYKGLRGKGFILPGLENHYDEEFSSVFDTYLKDVDLDLIGKEYIWYGFNVEMEYARDYDDSELCINELDS